MDNFNGLSKLLIPCPRLSFTWKCVPVLGRDDRLVSGLGELGEPGVSLLVREGLIIRGVGLMIWAVLWW